MTDLKWTGERLVTQADKLHGTIEHLHRYAVAVDLCKNKTVLDIACGEGYGSNILSSVAHHVYGVDISQEAVDHAARKYNKQNISFKQGSADMIPLPDGSVDIVVSFETIEHHSKHTEMMLEIKRVLKQGGVLLLSSPEKSIYSTRDSNNPYHIKEITNAELKELINKYFRHTVFLEQRFVFGSLITPEERKQVNNFNFYDGDFSAITHELSNKDEFYNKVFFNLVVASDNSDMPDLYRQYNSSFFNGSNVLLSETEKYMNAVAAVKASTSYKLGNFFVRPFIFLKSLFKK